MPAESACILVSHLPSACSFYLEVLTSLNYRFAEDINGTIGFGPNGEKPDLYLRQRTDSQESSTQDNLAFVAPSASAVDSFANAAPRAGGSVIANPVLKDCEYGTYTATISDLDGNTITATCNDPTMSTASYPRSVATSRNDEDDASEGSGRMRITVRTQTSEPPGSTSSSNNDALIGTLLGVAAGVAVTYLVGKDRKSPTPDPPQSQPRQAVTYTPQRQISYPSTPQSYTSGSRGEAADYFGAKPRLLRSATYHYEYSMPPSPDSSPKNYRYITQSRAPSVSEVQSVVSRSSNHQPLMIEASGENASGYRQILPPSPPSSISSRSQRSAARRTESPSPVRSSASKASQRTIRPEQLALPASGSTSQVSAPRSQALSHRSKHAHYSTMASSAPRSQALSHRSKHAHYSTMASSEASFHSAEQGRNPSAVSRRSTDPAAVALPDSRKTSVVSRTPTRAPLPESREPSIVSVGSFKSSTPSRKSSNAAYEIELPASVVGSRASSSATKPRHTSTASRSAHDYPLPASRQTSIASRVPENIPLPRSTSASHVSSASTLKPANPSASALAYQNDDLESLAPSDSISQISVRKHRRKKHSSSGSHSSGHKEGKKRSVVSLPERETKKEKEKGRVASLLGL